MINSAVTDAISKMSKDELREVYELVKKRFDQINRVTAQSLNVGDKVVFQARGGTTVHGKITKINTKSIKVLAETNTIWNVAPSLLKLAGA